MSEINWTSEGEKVFEKIIDTIPEAMREMLKPKLLELLAAKSKGEPVTPEIIIQMVQEDLPEPQKSVLMDMLTETSNEKKQPSSQDGMPSLEWSGKSANMFDTILGQVPDAMREVFRGKLLEIIIQKSIFFAPVYVLLTVNLLFNNLVLPDKEIVVLSNGNESL